MGTPEEPIVGQGPSGGGPASPEGRDGIRLVLRTVDAIAAEVARTIRLSELLPTVLRTLVDAVGADAGIIRLLDEGRTALRAAASVGYPEGYVEARPRLPVDDATLSGRAIRTGRIQAVACADQEGGVFAAAREAGFASIVCAPMVADGWPVGTIGFSSRAPGRFGGHQEQLLSTVSHHLATAVARAQLFDGVAQGKAEWEQLFDAMGDGVALCRLDGHLLRANRSFAALFGTEVQRLPGAPCPLGIPHAADREARHEVEGPRPGQQLLVNTLPLLDASRTTRRVFHVVHDVTAERAAAADLRQQNLLLKEARAEAELFGEIAHSVATSLHLEDVLNRIVEAGRNFVGVDLCGINLPDPDGRFLAGTAMSGDFGTAYREVRIPLDLPYGSAVAWRERRTVVVEDMTNAPFRTRVADRLGFASAIHVPLLGPQGPVGVMNFFHTGRPRPFSPESVRRAERLAGHAALAIENARLHRELAEHAAGLEERVRERTEALEAASRHKSDFLAHMSHELRTPLNAILGFSSMLLEGHGGPLAEKGRRYATQVHQSGQHLLALINDVLDLSRVEAGRLELRRQPVALATALAGVVDLMRGLAASRGVTVSVESPDWGLTARADPTRLHQIITNLLSNAIKFTPSGGRVTLRAARVRPSAAPPDGGTGPRDTADWVEIVVADTGVGIRPEDLGRLFRPFEQLQNRLRRSHEGTGLGLALTRRLVELHGGHILAESSGPNLGSTFTVRFPLDGQPAGRTVAVVEDDPRIQQVVAEGLKEAGYSVVLAGNAAEGARLLSARPDLLILDLILPDKSGKEVLGEVRGRPETRDLPVLVISGSRDVTADDLRAAGADEFLTKPFSLTVLADTVARLLTTPPPCKVAPGATAP